MKSYIFPIHIKDDTFSSRKITFPFDISDCQIDLDFKYQMNNKVAFGWYTDDLTFEKISQFEIVMKSRILDFPPHIYVYDLQVTFSNGDRKTYFGGSMEIKQDITK